MTTNAPHGTAALLTPIQIADADTIRQRLNVPEWKDPHSGDFFREYLVTEFAGQRLAAMIVVTGMIERTGEYLAIVPPIVRFTWSLLAPDMIAKLATDDEGAATLRAALVFAQEV